MLKWIYTFLFFYSSTIFAQTHCASVELFLEDQGNSMFVFDNFSTYQSGYPRTTVARLKVRVMDKETPDNLCSWNLKFKQTPNVRLIQQSKNKISLSVHRMNRRIY